MREINNKKWRVRWSRNGNMEQGVTYTAFFSNPESKINMLFTLDQLKDVIKQEETTVVPKYVLERAYSFFWEKQNARYSRQHGTA